MRFLLIPFCALLLLAGCQAQNDHAVPFSNGPTTPPSVEGPDTPPPSDSQQPDAISEEETGTFTLETVQ